MLIYFRWEGDDNDYEGILGYLGELFQEQDDQQHEIHVVHTCATDTENLSRINANVQNIILKNILSDLKNPNWWLKEKVILIKSDRFLVNMIKQSTLSRKSRVSPS